MNFHVALAFVEFASLAFNSFNELDSPVVRTGWIAVGEDCDLVPFERDATEGSDQRFPAFAVEPGLEARPKPLWC